MEGLAAAGCTNQDQAHKAARAFIQSHKGSLIFRRGVSKILASSSGASSGQTLFPALRSTSPLWRQTTTDPSGSPRRPPPVLQQSDNGISFSIGAATGCCLANSSVANREPGCPLHRSSSGGKLPSDRVSAPTLPTLLSPRSFLLDSGFHRPRPSFTATTVPHRH
jgi:hypothetical protein